MPKIQDKVPYKYQGIIYSFINNDTIKVWEQDKGRGVVVTDCSKYTEKCLGLLEIDQSQKLNMNQQKCIESIIQRCLCELKRKIAKDDYVV